MALLLSFAAIDIALSSKKQRERLISAIDSVSFNCDAIGELCAPCSDPPSGTFPLPLLRVRFYWYSSIFGKSGISEHFHYWFCIIWLQRCPKLLHRFPTLNWYSSIGLEAKKTVDFLNWFWFILVRCHIGAFAYTAPVFSSWQLSHCNKEEHCFASDSLAKGKKDTDSFRVAILLI